jgi:hypothetical protein
MQPILLISIIGVVSRAFFLKNECLYLKTQKSYKKIHRWCTITLVLIITRAAFFVAAVFFTADTAFVSSFGFIGFLYQLFCLWFVRMCEDRLRLSSTKLDHFNTLEDDLTMRNTSGADTMMETVDVVTGASSLYHQNHNMNHFKKDAFAGGENRYGRTVAKTPCNFSHENELHGQRSCGHLEQK